MTRTFIGALALSFSVERTQEAPPSPADDARRAQLRRVFVAGAQLLSAARPPLSPGGENPGRRDGLQGCMSPSFPGA